MPLLRNDFTFGFELEAFARNSDFLDEYDPEDFPEYLDECGCNILYEHDGYLDDFYGNINRFFMNTYNLRGFTHYDGSLKNYSNGYTGFEWSSPVLKFDTTNLLNVKKLLQSLNNNDIHINHTCGFHTHFSYKGICEDDVLWILLYVSSNEDAYKKFTELEYIKNGQTKDIKFQNKDYAETDYLRNIKAAFKNKDYTELCNCFSDYKYRVLRIHPQGTIEWRGPREFLYTSSGVDAYIKRMYEVVDIFIKALNTKEIYGFTREEFYECVHENMLYDCNFRPELTLREKRRGSHGIFPWFWDKANKSDKMIDGTILNRFVADIIAHPYNINDIKYSNNIEAIIYKLNELNCLRKVVTSVINNGMKLNKNVQYRMVYENLTLLPLMEFDMLKYFNSDILGRLFSNSSFMVESDYKHIFLDYVFTKLPLKYTQVDIAKMFNLLVKNDKQQWVIKYTMSKYGEKLKEMLIELAKSVHMNLSTVDKENINNVNKDTTVAGFKDIFMSLCLPLREQRMENVQITPVDSNIENPTSYTTIRYVDPPSVNNTTITCVTNDYDPNAANNIVDGRVCVNSGMSVFNDLSSNITSDSDTSYYQAYTSALNDWH